MTRQDDGIPVIAALMLASGGMCPKCAHGTRVTSKRWARCKKCGMRVRRRTEDETVAMVKRCTAEAR